MKVDGHYLQAAYFSRKVDVLYADIIGKPNIII